MNRHLGELVLPGAALLTLLSSVSANAAEDGAEVHRVLASVQSLYENFEYEQAFLQIQSARRLPRGTEEEVRLSLYEGIILCETGNFASAENAFRSALLMRPDAMLPIQVAPKIEALFESQRKKVKQTLAVTATPQVAQPESARPLVDVPQRSEPSPFVSSDNASGATPSPLMAPSMVSGDNESTRSSLRDNAIVPISAGLVAVMAGGTSWFVSRQYLAEPRGASASAQVFQNVGISLVGLGSAALITGVCMYSMNAPDSSISLGVGSDGTSAFVHGRWP
ncbi:hypothetical protein [Melittangium boletus]|nr:hypothetical protein [Melittangium boletus]